MTTQYSNNDWRYFLMHKEGSKYDWSSGTNPSDYNHDYWEKNKDEIMAKRRQKDGAVRDFGGAGIGYKAKVDGTDDNYDNDDDWSDELTEDELANIEAHNKQVDDNISELTKTVNDYISANKDKLSSEQISALKKNLSTQISIANEQRISTKNSDDYNYIMGLRKQSGASKSAASTNSSSVQKSSSTSRSKSSSSSSSKSSSNSAAKQAEYERMTEKGAKEAAALAARNAQKNATAKRAKEEEERIKNTGRSTK